MRHTRSAAFSAIALTGALALSACGSDNNTGEAAGGESSAVDCPTGTLNAEGSSAQKNAFEQTASTFIEDCAEATVNYNSTSSGTGIKQFIGGQVDFAGSDSALKTVEKDGVIESEAAAQYCGSPAWNLPMVTGPIAVAYNLEGVDKLVLNADVLADIFNGKITTWNDQAIAALNDGVELPSDPIKVFFRSDESGTTENFTKYLSAAAPEKWTAEPAKAWTGKGEGKPKSDGVASAVKGTKGGITYAEWSYAKNNDLGVAQIDTGAGAVELNAESAGKAVSAAEQVGEGNDLALKLDYATKEAGAYPIVLVTYEIVCSKAKDPAKVDLLKAYLKHFASAENQEALVEIGYAPLPEGIDTKVNAAIDALS